jgi:hypothetical protein
MNTAHYAYRGRPKAQLNALFLSSAQSVYYILSLVLCTITLHPRTLNLLREALK